mmetsp:Transcript_33828/g.80106  ORF Transcript_33828/g.80106 Transcript_33828/m.80106 type:complete len:246 (+) Transcript_33828:1011-1748(+)
MQLGALRVQQIPVCRLLNPIHRHVIPRPHAEALLQIRSERVLVRGDEEVADGGGLALQHAVGALDGHRRADARALLHLREPVGPVRFHEHRVRLQPEPLRAVHQSEELADLGVLGAGGHDGVQRRPEPVPLSQVLRQVPQHLAPLGLLALRYLLHHLESFVGLLQHGGITEVRLLVRFEFRDEFVATSALLHGSKFHVSTFLYRDRPAPLVGRERQVPAASRIHRNHMPLCRFCGLLHLQEVLMG